MLLLSTSDGETRRKFILCVKLAGIGLVTEGVHVPLRLMPVLIMLGFFLAGSSMVPRINVSEPTDTLDSEAWFRCKPF